jgi:hypothetical protein
MSDERKTRQTSVLRCGHNSLWHCDVVRCTVRYVPHARTNRTMLPKERTNMDELIDNIARVLATPMPRRQAFRVIAGALAAAGLAAVGSRPVSAAPCPNPPPSGQFTCGSGNNAACCNRQNECCALRGNRGMCCKRGDCVCNNGTCSSSAQGNCPSGCFLCAPA